MGGGDALAAHDAVEVADPEDDGVNPCGQIVGGGVAHLRLLKRVDPLFGSGRAALRQGGA